MSFEDQLRRSFEAAIAEATAAARERAERARQEGIDEGHAKGLEEGRALGLEEGHARGLEEGRTLGEQAGHAKGWEKGLAHGRDEGWQQGHAEGHEQGHAEGRESGLAEGREHGHAEGHEHGHAEGHQKGHAEGHEKGREEADREAQARIEAAMAEARVADRLAQGLREIDSARSLAEILDTLLGCARREAARTALFLVRNGRLRSWRLIGFGAVDTEPPFDVEFREGGIIADAVSTRAMAKSAIGILPTFASLAAGRARFAAPLELAGDVVAVLYADDQESDPNADSRIASPANLDMLAKHAARCLESLVAIRAARAIVQPNNGDGGPAEEVGESDAAARRYAKLLVSEIRLYHEADVDAGRRERNLAARLGGEIARARVMYEERIPQAVRDRADYFTDELVRTLANGDATLLPLT